MKYFCLFITLIYVYSLRDRLYDASYIGDVKLVEALLLEDPDVLTSQAPIK